MAGEAAAAAQTVKQVNGVTKKGKKGTATNGAINGDADDQDDENMDDVDSEVELDKLVKAVRTAQVKGTIGVPLAVPGYAGSWFVVRRERLRNCRDLLAGAFASRGGIAAAGAGRLN